MIRKFKHADSVFLLLLLAASIFFGVTSFKTWEFSNDDTLAVVSAAQISRGQRIWFWLPSSIGVSHTALVYYIYALFFSVYPKLISIQVCVLYFSLIAQCALLKTSEELLAKPFQYLAGILFFISPAFALFYFQKFWEPAILPAFVILAFYSLLQYVKFGKFHSLFLCISAISVAISCHQLAVILYIPLVQILLKFRVPKHSPFLLGALACIALLGLSSWIKWFIQFHPWFFVPIILMIAAPFFMRKLLNFERNYFHYYCVSLFSALGIATLWNGPKGVLVALQDVSDLFSGNSLYLPRHVGWLPFTVGTAWLFPEAALLVIYFYREIKNFKGSNNLEKILLIWIVGTMVPFLFVASFSHSIAHQWAIFIFPTIWIAILKPVSDFYLLKRPYFRIVSVAIVLLLLIPALFHTLQWEEKLKKQDGTGWHAASLGAKREILQTIYSESNHPVIFLASNGGFRIHDYFGWNYLKSEIKAQVVTQVNEESYWYIHSTGALQEDLAIFRKLEEKCRVSKTTGFLILFRCNQDLRLGTVI